MKTGFRRMVAIFLGVLVIAMLAGSVPVSAGEQGQLTLSFQYNDQPLQNVSFRAYFVASLQASESEAVYTPVSPFTTDRNGQVVNYTGLTTEQSIDLADWFASLTASIQNGISGTTDASGTATLNGLQDGMYLIVQTDQQKADGMFSPFLVSVPKGSQSADGYSWSYAVTAEPKYEKKNDGKPTVTPTVTPVVTPGTPKNTPPVKTGDTSNVPLYSLLFGISMAVLFVLVRYASNEKAES
ncbi:MAG: sortase B protein-sorting domain-containing protein [Eubacterium sp.]|nr:sortase B protein-sorting domain-containing protein [Eubacterium sp.]